MSQTFAWYLCCNSIGWHFAPVKNEKLKGIRYHQLKWKQTYHPKHIQRVSAKFSADPSHVLFFWGESIRFTRHWSLQFFSASVSVQNLRKFPQRIASNQDVHGKSPLSSMIYPILPSKNGDLPYLKSPEGLTCKVSGAYQPWFNPSVVIWQKNMNHIEKDQHVE